MYLYSGSVVTLNHKTDIILFATNVNPLQLYHSPRAKILAFKYISLILLFKVTSSFSICSIRTVVVSVKLNVV